jgi:DNA gyrase subunit B
MLHLVKELVDNSIDEALAGHCDKINITIHKDNSVTVKDNGRGIPVDKHAEGKSAAEVVFTVLHAGGKFDKNSYKVSGGLHGVGASVVNALSTKLDVEICRNGKKYEMVFENQVAKIPLREAGPTKDRGTKVTFWPDPNIFQTIEFDYKIMKKRYREFAFLNPTVTIVFTDERNDVEEVFHYEGGLSEFVKFMIEGSKQITDVVAVSNEKEDVTVDVALAYTDGFNESLEGFVNNISTPGGGTHVTGFKLGITRALKDYLDKHGKPADKKMNVGGDDIREGITAIISVKVPEPQFEGQTKDKLGNPEVQAIVNNVFYDKFYTYLDENPKYAQRIIDKAIQAKKARDAAKKARDLVRRKNVLEFSSLPGKLADCSSKDPKECEVFLVEGDSAGGCFVGETKIALADGRELSFKELIEEDKKGIQNFCYTIKDDGSIGIEKILHPRITKKDAELVEITLDNGEKIKCTPDHKFMIRNGEYVQAQNLKPKQSLMPLYKKLSKKEGRITIDGYEMVQNPKNSKWVFTHILSDDWNIKNGSDSIENGKHKHHIDFNKLNNNPTNLTRMTSEEHLNLHREMAKLTLHTEETKEKCRKIKQCSEYRENARMKSLNNSKLLSEKAKKQWENEEYKKYMNEKYLEFYYSNEEYRSKTLERLNKEQKKYWSKQENIDLQSEKIKSYFENNPKAKEDLRIIAKKQWNSQELLDWRAKKTSQQWTTEFREKRKKALNETYYEKSMTLMKELFDKKQLRNYDKLRIEKKDKSLLKYETVVNRYFEGNGYELVSALKVFNHKVVSVSHIKSKENVYDIEVPNTHNFALASGVFVHNSAKQGRVRDTQAILPLRGKILNVEKARFVKVLENEEIKTMITALGTGFGDNFNIEGLRYHKIVIMTDADVDGSHIATLLLTFFFRHFKELILNGHIYLAMPPLYKVKQGKKETYLYNDIELENYRKENPEVKFEIQRYKGLGEMNPEQLWETTLDPEVRYLKKITIDDAIEADMAFSMLMGDKVEPRKNFIVDNAQFAKDLDI